MQEHQSIAIDTRSSSPDTGVTFTYSASHQVNIACDTAKRASCVSHIGTLPTRVFDLLVEAKVRNLTVSEIIKLLTSATYA